MALRCRVWRGEQRRVGMERRAVRYGGLDPFRCSLKVCGRLPYLHALRETEGCVGSIDDRSLWSSVMSPALSRRWP